ncbi:HET-domain-containing protein [Pyrenochaeta sp. DS3sAY3a]|nr:HET-domain-containing protein [Pyrenochaeta sp. DS3sAY3a]
MKTVRMATEPRPRSRKVYSTLVDPAKYIRLLKVEADSARSDSICVSIHPTLFDHTLTYQAVSYAWGSCKEEEEITVDGEKRMTVRKNCADVLRQLAHFNTTTTEYYWVDAICINQSDRQEKSFQVNMMGKIFGQADCVLACIGRPRGDGQSLGYWLGSYPIVCFPGELQDGLEQQMESDLLLHKKWLDGLPAADVVQFAEALDEVAKLPYFTRIWILQELFLARRVRILYGTDELSLPTLLFWWQESRPNRGRSARVEEEDVPILYRKLCSTGAGLAWIHNIFLNDPEFSTEEGGYRLGKAYEDMLLKCVRSARAEASAIERRIRPSELLDLCKNLLCQDPIDTVYGTLELVDWTDARTLTLDGHFLRLTDSGLEADYTKPPFDLAKELLPYFNDLGQMLQILRMLRITQADISISDDIVRRWDVSSAIHVESDEYVLSMAKKSTQKHVHVAGGCVQITTNGPYRLRNLRRSSRKYVGIVDSNASLCGFATAGVQTEDWIFPTCCRYGIVLRQTNASGMFYAIVGRVAWSDPAINDNFPLATFMFCLGVQDVMVHLVQSVDVWDKESDEEPSKALQAALNVPFCSEPFSSFAVLMDNEWGYSEGDWKGPKESEEITRELMLQWGYALRKLRGYGEDPSLDSGLPWDGV